MDPGRWDVRLHTQHWNQTIPEPGEGASVEARVQAARGFFQAPPKPGLLVAWRHQCPAKDELHYPDKLRGIDLPKEADGKLAEIHRARLFDCIVVLPLNENHFVAIGVNNVAGGSAKTDSQHVDHVATWSRGKPRTDQTMVLDAAKAVGMRVFEPKQADIPWFGPTIAELRASEAEETASGQTQRMPTTGALPASSTTARPRRPRRLRWPRLRRSQQPVSLAAAPTSPAPVSPAPGADQPGMVTALPVSPAPVSGVPVSGVPVSPAARVAPDSTGYLTRPIPVARASVVEVMERRRRERRRRAWAIGVVAVLGALLCSFVGALVMYLIQNPEEIDRIRFW
jgi:hypothetical protein